MEVLVQKCQNCGSTTLKNILFREPGEPDKVFVQCEECQLFVASYVLAPLGYYHHRRGYDSFLRSLYRSGDFLSGRNIQRMYEERQQEELKMYEVVLAKLRERDAEEE